MTRRLAVLMRAHRAARERGDEVARLVLTQRILSLRERNIMAFRHAYDIVFGVR